MNKFLTKIAVAFVGMAMAVGVGALTRTQHKESFEAKAEESTLSYSGSGSNAKVTYNSVERNGVKIGTGKYTGTAIFSVPTGATSCSFYAAAWKNMTIYLDVAISDTNATISPSTTEQLTANDNVSGSGTSYTINGTDDDYLYTFTLTNVTKNSNVTITTNSDSNDYRAAIWYACYETSTSSTYSVTYDDNGATSGSVPTDPTEYDSSNNTVTVLGNTGGLVKANTNPSFNYTFGGWNTKADGTGTGYVEDDTFTISKNTTLFAVWEDPRTEVTLIATDLELTTKSADADPILTSSPADLTDNYVLTSGDESVATIVNGKVHPVAKGSATISVHIDSTSEYIFADTSFTVTVSKAMDDSGTGTIEFGTSPRVEITSASATGEDSQGNTWTIATTGTTSYTKSSTYMQIGSSSNPADDITLSATFSKKYKLNTFSISLGGFSGTEGDVSVKVDGNEVASGSLNDTSNVSVGISSSVVGKALSIKIDNIDKGVKLVSISYTFETCVDVTSVSLDKASATLSPEETLQLTETVLPANASDKSVTWSTSNADYATVSDAGLVTAVAEGSATITATSNYDGTKKATCTITVAIPEEPTVTLDKTVASGYTNQTVSLTATQYNIGSYLRWKSSNTDRATVPTDTSNTSVTVTLVKTGTAGQVTITAYDNRDEDNVKAECVITVSKSEITGITGLETSKTIKVGKTATLSATATYVGTVDSTTITWNSTDETVATVSSEGVVTALAEGTTDISASCGGQSAVCEVTVQAIDKYISMTPTNFSTGGYYTGTQEVGDYTIASSRVMQNASKIQMEKSKGVIYNTTTPFNHGIKMIKIVGTGVITVTFDTEIKSVAGSVASKTVVSNLGTNVRYYVPDTTSNCTYFHIAKNGTDTGYLTLIEVYSAETAASEFASMYLDAYTCTSSGISNPTAKTGYTVANIGTLYNQLDTATKAYLTGAVDAAISDHDKDTFTDDLEEFGCRYYWIVRNHGQTYDFMNKREDIGQANQIGLAFINSNDNSLTLIIILISSISLIAIAGYCLLRRRKEQ